MNYEKRPYWLSAAIGLWGLVWVWQGMGLPLTDRYAHIGPGLPVVGIGAGLVIFAAILALQIRAGVPFEEQAAEDVSVDHRVSWRGLSFAAAGAAVPMLTMRHLGFVITCTLAFWLITRAFRSPRPALDLVIGAVVSLGAWYLFRLLGVQLGGLLPIAGI